MDWECSGVVLCGMGVHIGECGTVWWCYMEYECI